ncbi:MAG: trypsin-like peptidase domain-containing protein [Chloroflexi bacterium]|nr:trypsin-like peptidase domain-containing protein [Chloroflexota bacterium]
MKHITRERILVAIIAFILLAGVTGRLPVARAEPTRAQLDNAMQATMKIYVLDTAFKVIGGCSGTVIDPAGYVLTNFHCVGTTTGQARSDPKLKAGTFKNPQGFVALGPTVDPRKAPKATYYARYIAGNHDLDVAVLKITSMVNKGQALPKPLPLVPIVRADSDQVQIGDYVAAIGYPGVGGETVTFTDGKISGFDDLNADGMPDSLKVTASINGGNSGGLAINEEGDQIGIPTWSLSSAQKVEKLDRIVMINVAEPYIQKALQIGSAISNEPPSSGPIPPSGPSTVPSSGGKLGKIQFGTDFKNNQLVSPGATLPSGIKKLVGLFDFNGMKDGTDWGFVWSIDGQAVTGKSTGTTWKSGESGSYYVWLTNGDKALPDGAFKLSLYVNGALVAEGTATIGTPQTTPPKPQTPVPTNTGVTLRGQVLDADTQRGIEAALLIILQPGVSISEFVSTLNDGGDIEALVAASAETDADGNYITAPPLARGQKYSVIVGAEDYERREFENGLEITTKHSNVITMDPVTLQQR